MVRRAPMKSLLAVTALALMACGPQARNMGDGVDAAPVGEDAHVPQARVTGTVFAPKNGPTQVAAGLEIPIAGALIYLSDTKLPPIPDHVYCEKCIDTPTGAVLTNADGSFDIKATPGNYWLTIQKGQFRLEQQVALVDGNNPLKGTTTTLPSLLNMRTFCAPHSTSQSSMSDRLGRRPRSSNMPSCS